MPRAARPVSFRLPARRALLALAGGLLVASLRAEPVLNRNPFGAPEGTPAAVVAPGTNPLDQLELAGLTSVGRDVFASIFDPRQNRSVWIIVGGKEGDLELVHADVALEEVQIRLAGQTRTLGLRRVKLPAAPSVVHRPAAPAPVSAGARPAPPIATPTVAVATGIEPPARPLTREEQETEARMLVHDLLEIGMQQRKAYEAAQRKAREDALKKAGTNGAGSATTATPTPR